jgi:hypothetical protein
MTQCTITIDEEDNIKLIRIMKELKIRRKDTLINQMIKDSLEVWEDKKK